MSGVAGTFAFWGYRHSGHTAHMRDDLMPRRSRPFPRAQEARAKTRDALGTAVGTPTAIPAKQAVVRESLLSSKGSLGPGDRVPRRMVHDNVSTMQLPGPMAACSTNWGFVTEYHSW